MYATVDEDDYDADHDDDAESIATLQMRWECVIIEDTFWIYP